MNSKAPRATLERTQLPGAVFFIQNLNAARPSGLPLWNRKHRGSRSDIDRFHKSQNVLRILEKLNRAIHSYGGEKNPSFAFSFKPVLVKSVLTCSSVIENEPFCSTPCSKLVTNRAQESVALSWSEYIMNSIYLSRGNEKRESCFK